MATPHTFRIRLTLSAWRQAAVLLAAVLLLGCGDTKIIDDDPVVVTLSAATVSIEELETLQLGATVTGTSGATLDWSSANPDVATVDGSGRVTGVSAGTAAVTALVSGGTASASATVTVTPLPLAITVDGFMQNGQPVSPDALGLGVSAEVIYDAPANFQGTIEIRAGTEVLGVIALPTPAASIQATSGVMVTAVRGARRQVPMTVTKLDAGSIRPLVTNGAETPLTGVISGVTGTEAQSGPQATVFNVSRRLALTSVVAEQSAVGPLGQTWHGGTFVVNGQIVDHDAVPAALEGAIEITVRMGAAATSLYGTVGVNGVILITTNDELRGQEGSFAFGETATLTPSGGSALSLPLVNVLEPGLGLPTVVRYDGKSPFGDPTAFPSEFFAGRDALAPQFADRFGLRANVFDDGGVGGIQLSYRVGLTQDLELGTVLDLDAYTDFQPEMFIGVDVTDVFSNQASWLLSTQGGDPARMGYDATGPVASRRTGTDFTADFAINPSLVSFGATFADSPIDGQPASGVDLDAVSASVRFLNASTETCFPGGFQNGECIFYVSDYDDAAASVKAAVEQPTYAGYYSVAFSAADQVGNAGQPSLQRGLIDTNLPSFSSAPTITLGTGGTYLAQWEATDDVEVWDALLLAQFTQGGAGTIPPIFFGSQQLGQRWDDALVSSSPVSITAAQIRSLEDWANKTVYPWELALAAQHDAAANRVIEAVAPPPLGPLPGSFQADGLEIFGGSAVASSVAADGLTDFTIGFVTSEAVPSLTEAKVFATLDPMGNPAPIAEGWVDFVVSPGGSGHQGLATFPFAPADLGLVGGETVYLFPMGRTSDWRGIFGAPVVIDIVAPGGAPGSDAGSFAADAGHRPPLDLRGPRIGAAPVRR